MCPLTLILFDVISLKDDGITNSMLIWWQPRHDANFICLSLPFIKCQSTNESIFENGLITWENRQRFSAKKWFWKFECPVAFVDPIFGRNKITVKLKIDFWPNKVNRNGTSIDCISFFLGEIHVKWEIKNAQQIALSSIYFGGNTIRSMDTFFRIIMQRKGTKLMRQLHCECRSTDPLSAFRSVFACSLSIWFDDSDRVQF